MFCIKKFPKSLARSSGAISFGNDNSDGSQSSDLVVRNKLLVIGGVEKVREEPLL